MELPEGLDLKVLNGKILGEGLGSTQEDIGKQDVKIHKRKVVDNHFGQFIANKYNRLIYLE